MFVFFCSTYEKSSYFGHKYQYSITCVIDISHIIHTCISTLIVRTTNAVSNESHQPKVIFLSEALLQEFLGADIHHHLYPFMPSTGTNYVT